MELGSYFLFLQEQIKDIIIIQEPRARNTEESPGQASPCRMKLSSGTLRGMKDAKEARALHDATKDFQERGRLAHSSSPATPETAGDSTNR